VTYTRSTHKSYANKITILIQEHAIVGSKHLTSTYCLDDTWTKFKIYASMFDHRNKYTISTSQHFP